MDYFDTTYGDKILDEETGEYVVEIFKTCSVCGYEETDTEQLDNSYDVYLSIPVEIPLSFDAQRQNPTPEASRFMLTEPLGMLIRAFNLWLTRILILLERR